MRMNKSTGQNKELKLVIHVLISFCTFAQTDQNHRFSILIPQDSFTVAVNREESNQIARMRRVL